MQISPQYRVCLHTTPTFTTSLRGKHTASRTTSLVEVIKHEIPKQWAEITGFYIVQRLKYKFETEAEATRYRSGAVFSEKLSSLWPSWVLNLHFSVLKIYLAFLFLCRTCMMKSKRTPPPHLVWVTRKVLSAAAALSTKGAKIKTRLWL